MAREGAVTVGVAVLRRGLEEEDMEALQGGARAPGAKKIYGGQTPRGEDGYFEALSQGHEGGRDFRTNPLIQKIGRIEFENPSQISVKGVSPLRLRGVRLLEF